MLAYIDKSSLKSYTQIPTYYATLTAFFFLDIGDTYGEYKALALSLS